MSDNSTKFPALFCVTTIIIPKINSDGSFDLPGQEALAQLVTQSVEDALKGLDGSIVNTVSGWTGSYIKYIPKPPQPSPVIPHPVPAETAPWWAALKKGSTVVNIKPKAPIDYYDAPQGNVTKKAVPVEWDMVLVADPVADNRIKDLGWLRVSDKIWVQSAAVKAK